jgi:uncharacterized membrane protein
MVMVVIAAFAIDIGMQRVVRRDMQSLADIVALDLVRELDGTRTLGDLTPLMPDLAAASQARNAGTLGDVPELEVELGKTDTSGDFVALTAESAIPTAVRVTAETSVGFAFVPGSGSANRSAVAKVEAGACFKLGSYALAVSSGDSALLHPLINEALGSNLDLQALGYNGLADVSVSLFDLLHVPGISVLDTDNLADIQPVTMNSFMLAVAQVLSDNGDTANAEILETLAVNAGSLGNVNLGDLVYVAQGNESALETQLNVLDLVTGAIFLANGSGLDVEDLGLNLPLIGSVTGDLDIIQSPQQKCGPVGTEVSTAQVNAQLTAQLAGLTLPNILGLTQVGITAPQATTVTLSLAGADGTLTDVQCEPDDSITVHVTSSLTSLALAAHVTVTARVQLNLPFPLNLSVVQLTLPYTITINANEEDSAGGDHTVEMPPYDVAHPTGTGTLGLSDVTANVSLDSNWTATLLGGLNVKGLAQPLLGGVLPLVLSGVTTSVVQPLAQGLDEVLIGPIQTQLGLQVAGADLFAVEPEPRCGEPRLVG